MRKMRQSERAELYDQRMIETAIRIVLSRGISGLRLTEIGGQAGYSRGLATLSVSRASSLRSGPTWGAGVGSELIEWPGRPR